jgi:hypothetical protein
MTVSTVAEQESSAPAGMACSGAPTVGALHDETHETTQFVLCHALHSGHTLVYRQGTDGTPIPGVVDLGGSAVGGPAVAEMNDDSLEVFITTASGEIEEGDTNDSGYAAPFTAYGTAIHAQPGLAADDAYDDEGNEILPIS